MSVTPPRQRILDAALRLVAEGGYDALQVRAIAERASVSSRTIYAYFPSLDSLLIVAVADLSGPLYQRYTESPPKGRTPAARVQRLIAELNVTMTSNRVLTVALLRALLSGKPDVAQHVRNFSDALQAVLASAIAPKGPTPADRATSEILQSIWFTSLIGWATGSDSEDHIAVIMRRASRRLLSANDVIPRP